jgi:hypothetical protein
MNLTAQLASSHWLLVKATQTWCPLCNIPVRSSECVCVCVCTYAYINIQPQCHTNDTDILVSVLDFHLVFQIFCGYFAKIWSGIEECPKSEVKSWDLLTTTVLFISKSVSFHQKIILPLLLRVMLMMASSQWLHVSKGCYCSILGGRRHQELGWDLNAEPKEEERKSGEEGAKVAM